MDIRSMEDRAAAWQARAFYREEYELNDRDVELEEVQTAYQQSQEAWSELIQQAVERSSAKEELDAAFQEVLNPGDTSSVVREQRERWVRAREDYEKAEAAYLDAQELARTTRQEYVRVLSQHF